MSFTDVILLKKITKSVISITAGLVLVLGAWILFSAFASAPETKAFSPAKFTSLSSSGYRQPSSIPVIAEVGTRFDSAVELKVETFQLGCLREKSGSITLKSSARQVRLKALLCNGQTTAMGSSSIVNRTNGYIATLFKLDQGGFTSDYISLAEGQNQILIHITDERGGHASSEVSIVRR